MNQIILVWFVAERRYLAVKFCTEYSKDTLCYLEANIVFYFYVAIMH